MNENLQFLATVSQVIALFVAIIALVFQILAWLKPNTHLSLTPWFRAIRPFLPFIIVATIFFWLGYRLSIHTSETQQPIEVRHDIPVTVMVDKPVEVTRIFPVTQIIEATRLVEIPITQIVTTTPPPFSSESTTTSVVPTRISSIALPFSDDFDNGIDKQWISEGGDWGMANGFLVNRGSPGILWLGKAEWSDIIVEFDSESNYCGDLVQVLVRMQNPYDFIAVRVAGCNNEGTYLYKGGNESKKIVGVLGRGKHWQIIVTGTIFRVIVDGKLRSTGDDQTFATGSVGIQMGTSGKIDNFTVRPYSP